MRERIDENFDSNGKKDDNPTIVGDILIGRDEQNE